MIIKIVIFVCGFLIGLLIRPFIVRKKPDGIFQINYSKDAVDIYKLEVHTPLDIIPDKKTITFKVKTLNDEE